MEGQFNLRTFVRENNFVADFQGKISLDGEEVTLRKRIEDETQESPEEKKERPKKNRSKAHVLYQPRQKEEKEEWVIQAQTNTWIGHKLAENEANAFVALIKNCNHTPKCLDCHNPDFHMILLDEYVKFKKHIERVPTNESGNKFSASMLLFGKEKKVESQTSKLIVSGDNENAEDEIDQLRNLTEKRANLLKRGDHLIASTGNDELIQNDIDYIDEFDDNNSEENVVDGDFLPIAVEENIIGLDIEENEELKHFANSELNDIIDKYEESQTTNKRKREEESDGSSKRPRPFSFTDITNEIKEFLLNVFRSIGKPLPRKKLKKLINKHKPEYLSEHCNIFNYVISECLRLENDHFVHKDIN